MSRILEKLADQHEERMINVLYKLEDDVIKQVRKATKGELVSQRLAIQLQPQLRQVIEENFLGEADLIINEEYNKIAKEVLDNFGKLNIPQKFKSLTEIDLQTINALKYQSFSGFEDIAERFIKVINDEVYQSTIAGRPFDDMVSNIRSHINGVYRKSNSAEINELVDFINENKFDSAKKVQVEDAVRKLHTQYASDRAGNNLRRYAGQIAHDSVMQFHGQFTVAKAKEAGIDKFTYTGTLVRDSRDFCVEMLNKVLTEEQIREIWNSRGWQGKSTGDPFIVRGGYRCRHTWIPTVEEIVDEPPPEPEVEETPPEPLKKGRRSSLKNPVTEDEIDIISSTVVVDRLQKQITKNAKDDRYAFNKDGTPINKFGLSNIGIVSGMDKLDAETSNQILAIFAELDDLSKLYNVPNLRGIRVHKRSSAMMAMGDGVLDINPKYFSKNKADEDFRNAFVAKGQYQKENKLAKSFKLGVDVSNEKEFVPKTWKRPQGSNNFFDNNLDKLRSVIYHEFAHQVHQTKNYKEVTEKGGMFAQAPIEKALRNPTISRGVKGSSATRYSDENVYEWFAENFSLYHMGREELVDPNFIKFLENEVLK